MSYQPLARKYRPSQFWQLVGQEAVSVALANAIAMHREPHAVIFTGVRGIGKTTVARLYAKALNCDNRQVSERHPVEPCDVCASCLAIIAGNHEDVLEIDGASNNGVADVRALQETIDYRPQRSAYKIYIIDEVHMLSQAAFNALLKTLEEPPSHVVFAFATTEIGSVPQTIMSRCQAFYLKKLPTALIHARLVDILAREGVQTEDKAVAVVAREGHGSMRDALTLVDQAIALGQGRVTVAGLGPLVSTLSSSPYLALLGALVARDAARALAVVADLDQGGAELSAAVEAAAQLARHAFVAQGLGIKALDVALLGLDDGELATLAELARAAAPLDLNRIFRTLVKCRSELDGSALDRFVLENYLFEWCFDPGLPDVESLLSGASRAAVGPGAPSPKASVAGGHGGVNPPASTFAGPSGAAPSAPAVMPQSPQVPAPALAAPTSQAAVPPPSVAAPPSASPSLDGAVAAAPQSARLGGAGLRTAMSEFRGEAAVKPAQPVKEPIAPADAGAMGVGRPAAAVPSVPPPRTLTGAAGAALPGPGQAPPPAALDAPGLAEGKPRSAVLGEWPGTWRQLVDGWKQLKPLQARKLEEAHPIEYGPERIVLAIAEDSYAGKGLFQRDEQVRIRDQFQELFGFKGALVVVSAAPGAEVPAAPVAALPSTILAERRRESATRREQLIEETKNAPFTRDVLAALGGTLEGVKLPEGGHSDSF